MSRILLLFLSASCFQTALGQYEKTETVSDSSFEWILLIAFLVVIGAGAVVVIRLRPWDRSAKVPAKKQLTDLVYDWKPDFDSPSEDKHEAPKGGERDVERPARQKRTKTVTATEAALHGIDIDEVREKMEKIKFARLPINRFEKLDPPKPFEALPNSDEEELLSAIDYSDVEFVEDEGAREIALESIARFKARNAVDALAQMALYDLSSNLRCKAVMALADINHPSVFEPVMLSCADPTREVRASGARALFKLSFKRADSWLRLTDCADEYRVSQIAKAAIEADFVGRSLERLVHTDANQAYEALALLAVLIKAGETDDIFDCLVSGENKNVRLAILRVFTLVADDRVLERLHELVESGVFDKEIEASVRETLGSFALQTA